MSQEDHDDIDFFERFLTDEVKQKILEIAYGTCEGLNDIEPKDVGMMVIGVFGYGMYTGLALAREGVVLSEHNISSFLVMNPEIIAAIEEVKKHS